jgi:hypothetical protein
MRRIVALLLLLSATLWVRAQWAGLQPFVTYNAGDDVRLFHTKDLTGDAVPDLAVLYQAAHLSMGLLAGRGDGSFAVLQVKAKDDNYFLSDIADLNDDGHPDMVISSYWNNGFKIYWGQGGGRLQEGPFLPTGVHGRAVKCVDINKDGKMDVVSTTSGSGRTISLHVYLGRGNGSFDEKRSFPSVLDTSKDIIITDKNGDGLLDVVVTSSFPWIVLFKQGADGSFTPQYYPTWTPARVAIADMNRDGREDLLLLYASFDNIPGSDSLMIRFNEGGDDFSASVRVESFGAHKLRPSHLLVQDLDRDGYQDLVLNQHDWDGEPTDTLFYLMGREGGQFAAPQWWVAPGKVLYTAFADMNRDGWTDLLVSCAGGTVNIALNKGGRIGAEGQRLLVYPNPAREGIYVNSGLKTGYTLRLYNAGGQLVRQAWVQGPLRYLSTLQLGAGLYYVEVLAGGVKSVQAVVVSE